MSTPIIITSPPPKKEGTQTTTAAKQPAKTKPAPKPNAKAKR